MQCGRSKDRVREAGGQCAVPAPGPRGEKRQGLSDGNGVDNVVIGSGPDAKDGTACGKEQDDGPVNVADKACLRAATPFRGDGHCEELACRDERQVEEEGGDEEGRQEEGERHGLAPEDGGGVVEDGFGGDTFRAELGDERAQAGAEVGGFFGGEAMRVGGVGGDGGAAAVAEVEETFGGEGTEGFGDGVVMDTELGGELADARERVAGGELAGLDEEAELVDDLAIGGGGAAEIDGEGGLGHEATVHVYKTVVQLECGWGFFAERVRCWIYAWPAWRICGFRVSDCGRLVRYRPGR